MRTSGLVRIRSSLAIPFLGALLLSTSALASTESADPPYQPPGTAGVTVSLQPDSVALQPGDPLSVDVVISGLGDLASPSAGSFDLTVAWDDTLFTFNSLTFGSELGDLTMAEAIEGTSPLPGSVQAFEVSLLPAATLNANQPASFTLATLTFDGTGVLGSSTFDVGGLVSDENGIMLPFTAIGTRVSAGSVLDIPTLGDFAAVLMMIGLLIVGLITLRRVS